MQKTPTETADAFLARLTAAHPERVNVQPVIVRAEAADGTLQFAGVIERFGEKTKVKFFRDGLERWVGPSEIVEAA